MAPIFAVKPVGTSTVPEEAYDASHPDHDWYVSLPLGRCRALNCERHQEEDVD